MRARALALWLLLALCALPAAHAAAKIRFDIPAGPATETLTQFIGQTGLQVVFPSDDVRGIVTNEVRGEFDVSEALERLTRGTRLRYVFIDEDAVTVTVVPPAARRRNLGDVPVGSIGPPSIDRRSLNRELETVTVQTSLDRPSAFQPGSPIIVLTRDDIQAFGFSSAADVMRTLPQIFGGGPSEDTRQIGFEAQTNTASGAGVNLRGLGAGSALVLVNGRRLAGGGSEGIFTDIMSLPVSLIERIEILPDSSSSVYGSDAVGGVVNFILLNSLDGAQTEASYGVATSGPLDQEHVGQLIGINSSQFGGLIGMDFYSRDHLAARDREQARSDLTAFGGNNFDSLNSNPATVFAGNRIYGVPRGQDGSELTPASFIPNVPNRGNLWEGTDILPNQQRWSLYASGTLTARENVNLFADVLFSQRDKREAGGGVRTPVPVPVTNGYYVNPANDPRIPVVVAYDFSKDLGNLVTTVGTQTFDAVMGAEIRASEAWNLVATADFATEKLRSRLENTLDFAALSAALVDPERATAFNPFGDGSYTNPETLARMRATAGLTVDSQIMTGNLTATRTVPGFADSPGKLVTGVDYRTQRFNQQLRQGAAFVGSHDLERNVEAAFASLSLPVLGKPHSESRSNRLEVTAAGRYERYSDFGGIFTPRFGVTFAPTDTLALRGAWSRSFRPPNLLDLDETTNTVGLTRVPDASAPAGQSLVLVQTGKNSRLREERAESYTLGLDWDITWVPGLSAALTFFNTTFTDRMNAPRASGGALFTDASFTDIVTRNFTPEQRQAVCASAPLFVITPADCLNVPIAAIADLRVRNSALMKTNGIDVLGEYQRYLGAGSLRLRMDGTYVLSFRETSSRNLPLVEKVSTQNNPIDLRLRGTASWQSGAWRATALLTYFDDYRDILSVPHRRVDSWTTLDLNLAWSTEKGDSALSSMTLSLDAENVFDKDPPFLNNPIGIGYDQENGELLGRMVSVNVRKTW